jgi:fluoride exporter
VSLPVSHAALVAIGGLVGSVSRYWMSGVVQSFADHDFPSGTLAVNTLGSFVVAVVMTLSLDRGVIDDRVRILLATGFCGGFTTMSTFSYETLALLRDGDQFLAVANAAGSLGACLAAAWLGTVVARLV